MHPLSVRLQHVAATTGQNFVRTQAGQQLKVTDVITGHFYAADAARDLERWMSP
jgi:hypothetical protein